MTQKAIDMTQAKQIQQLSADGVSIKEIVRRTGISRKTVRKYLRKIEAIDHTLQVNVSGDYGQSLPVFQRKVYHSEGDVVS